MTESLVWHKEKGYFISAAIEKIGCKKTVVGIVLCNATPFICERKRNPKSKKMAVLNLNEVEIIIIVLKTNILLLPQLLYL